MRILMTCSPGAGHVYPFLALARTATQEGHDVRIATGPAYQATIERAGIRFYSAGLDWNTSTIDPREGGFMMWDKNPPVFTRDLLSLFETWQPDVVVREYTEFGGWLAAEKADIPHAVLSQGMPGDPARVPPQPRARLNEIRQAFGLPTVDSTAASHGYLLLEQLPPSWVEHRGYEPDTLHYIPPLLFTPDRDWAAPDWLVNLGERPLIFCTMGTVFNRAPRLFDTLIDAMALLDAEVVIATGRNYAGAHELREAENIHIEPFVPLSQIMKRCELVVCHGGLGTVLHALFHGVPLVTIPVGANQPVIAAHVHRSGAGVRILGQEPRDTPWAAVSNPDAITPDEVRTAASDVLSERRYAGQAQILQRELRSLGDDQKAIRLLEQLARTAAPIRR